MKLNQSFYYFFSALFLLITSLLYIDFNPSQLIVLQAINTSPEFPTVNHPSPAYLVTPAAANTVAKTNPPQYCSLTHFNNISIFQTKILNPVLIKLNLYSPASSNLLLGTAIQESLIGKLSKNIFQITLSTARNINTRYLSQHPTLKNNVNYFYLPQRSLAWNLSHNVNYEIAMATVIYHASNKKLPSATNIEGLGRFWKINYNTYFGRGTAHEFTRNFDYFLAHGYPYDNHVRV